MPVVVFQLVGVGRVERGSSELALMLQKITARRRRHGERSDHLPATRNRAIGDVLPFGKRALSCVSEEGVLFCRLWMGRPVVINRGLTWLHTCWSRSTFVMVVHMVAQIELGGSPPAGLRHEH